MTGPLSKDKKTLLLAIVAGLVAFLVYIPSFSNGFLNWDDKSYIYGNPWIRKIDLPMLKAVFTMPISMNWHPLTQISLAIDYSLWGLDPFWYHFENALFHGLNTFLMGLLASRITGGGGRGNVAGFVAALLFALHPLHVESIAWASERKDVLSTFFSLLVVISYLNYAEGKRKALHYLLALLFFVLALLSKPMAVTLPVVLLILDFYPIGRRGRQWVRAFVEKAPFFALSILASMVTVWAQRAFNAISSLETYSLSVRVWNAVRGYAFYLYKTFVPVNLAPLYPHPGDAFKVFSLEYAGALALLVCVTILCLYSLRRTRAFLAAWFFYVVTLLPVIGIVQVGGQAVADRYAYIPTIPIFMLVGAGFAMLLERLERARALALAFAAFVVFAALGALTVKQEAIWKDSITFWTYEIGLHGDAALPYINRGLAYDEKGLYREALADFDRAVELNPRFYAVYVNRGNVYNSIGEYQSAIIDFSEAIRLKSDYAEAYNNRGVSYKKLGNLKFAMENFLMAIRLDPALGSAYHNLGILYSDMGEMELAVKASARADELGYR